jgi:hypothetical protein
MFPDSLWKIGLRSQVMINFTCPGCQKRCSFPDDHDGQPAKCPACGLKLTVRKSSAPPLPVVVAAPPPPPPPPLKLNRAKATARFGASARLLFHAAVEAIRSFECDLLNVDSDRFIVRFSCSTGGIAIAHEAIVFDVSRRRSEIELTSQQTTSAAAIDRLYDSILKEIDKFLLFADEQETPASEQPDGNAGFAITGFICGIVGLPLFFIPLLPLVLGTLGIIFSAIGKGDRFNGLATAGLVCGIIADAVALIFTIYMFSR